MTTMKKIILMAVTIEAETKNKKSKDFYYDEDFVDGNDNEEIEDQNYSSENRDIAEKKN